MNNLKHYFGETFSSLSLNGDKWGLGFRSQLHELSEPLVLSPRSHSHRGAPHQNAFSAAQTPRESRSFAPLLCCCKRTVLKIARRRAAALHFFPILIHQTEFDLARQVGPVEFPWISGEPLTRLPCLLKYNSDSDGGFIILWQLLGLQSGDMTHRGVTPAFVICVNCRCWDSGGGRTMTSAPPKKVNHGHFWRRFKRNL